MSSKGLFLMIEATPKPRQACWSVLITTSAVLQDCVAVESRVKDAFGRDKGPSAIIVYVGQRPEWVIAFSPDS